MFMNLVKKGSKKRIVITGAVGSLGRIYAIGL